MAGINRIKEVLIEKKITGRWLAKTLEKDVATVSRWCNNHTQPSLEVLDRMATVLKVDRRELLNKSE
ncbi:MAG: helix-turn-helix transcriptional regulator [Rikenellaceae bacterium]